ncbi:hypothetical protein GPECTOR_47g327 [Gonium pectorale]|uniref:Peptidase S1 domain-containing protein n=1 Tax=Gonium pectorale TaxID=33097 RepID=A0A150G880_GONPE|nr:hypothetical protein GPECTOR_47g327 [Gonium pectorale]|eukprot:KXZ46052.1 hypothetical protein GPECTOR_47g327 [Gonium pectorale]
MLSAPLPRLGQAAAAEFPQRGRDSSLSGAAGAVAAVNDDYTTSYKNRDEERLLELEGLGGHRGYDDARAPHPVQGPALPPIDGGGASGAGDGTSGALSWRHSAARQLIQNGDLAYISRYPYVAVVARLDGSYLCAGALIHPRPHVRTATRRTCAGDSGGPLILHNGDGNGADPTAGGGAGDLLVGHVSFGFPRRKGQGCPAPNPATVFADLRNPDINAWVRARIAELLQQSAGGAEELQAGLPQEGR